MTKLVAAFNTVAK